MEHLNYIAYSIDIVQCDYSLVVFDATSHGYPVIHKHTYPSIELLAHAINDYEIKVRESSRLR